MSTRVITTPQRRATTPSGGSTSGYRSGAGVWQDAQVAGDQSSTAGYYRSLEIGAGTGYFSLNLLQAVLERGHLHRYLPGDDEHAAVQRRPWHHDAQGGAR